MHFPAVVHCFLGISFWRASAPDLPYWLSCIFLHSAQFPFCAECMVTVLSFLHIPWCPWLQSVSIKADLFLLQPEELRNCTSEPQIIPRTLPTALKATSGMRMYRLNSNETFPSHVTSKLVLENKNVYGGLTLAKGQTPTQPVTHSPSSTQVENRMRRLAHHGKDREMLIAVMGKTKSPGRKWMYCQLKVRWENLWVRNQGKQ